MNKLISKTIDAVEIHSETDLTLETNTQIRLNTSNLLINSVPFDKYIRKLIFDETYTSESDIHMITNRSTSSDVNLTESMVSGSKFVVDNLYCANIDANTSYVNIDKHHCITLSARNEILFINEQGGSNIEYNRDSLTDCSLSNYIYNVINGVGNTDDLTPYLKTKDTHEFDVTNFGTYYTNKIITSNVVTTNSYTMPANEEPVFNISSKSAINLQIYDVDDLNTIGTKIKFGTSSTDTIDLKSYIYQYLDETDMFTITGNMGSGQDITMDLLTFVYSGTIDVFTYDLYFEIYKHNDDDEIMLGNREDDSPILDVTECDPNSTYENVLIFRNLNPGEFYTIFANIRNRKTNTFVNNVKITPFNIPTIEHVVISSIIVVNEKEILIKFKPHPTVISNWSSDGKKVRFYIRMIDPNATNLLPTVNFQEIDLSLSPRPYQEYTIDVTQFSDYSHSDKLSLNGSYQTIRHIFEIVSRHKEGGTFEMTSASSLLTTFTFSSPNTPSNFTMNATGNLFTWTISTNNELITKITRIFYNIYRNGRGSNKINNSNLEDINNCNNYNNVKNASGVIPDIYKIQASNIFGQYSNFIIFTVNPLSVTKPIISAPTSANKIWTIEYTVLNNNGKYNVTTNLGTDVAGTNDLFTRTLDPGTYDTWVQIKDSFIEVKSTNANTLIIYQPTISFGTHTFDSAPRKYKIPVSIDAPNNNTTSIYSISAYSLTNCSIVSTTTSTTTSYITIQVENTTSDINISGQSSVVDGYGYTSRPSSFSKNIIVSYANITLSIVGINRVFTCTLSTLLSYSWIVPGNIVYGQSTNTITLSDNGSNFGIVTCNVIQSDNNNNGFTKQLSTSISNNVITINNGSFTILSFTTYTRNYTLTNGFLRDVYVKNSSNNVIDMTSSSKMNVPGVYTLYGNFENQYRFVTTLTIGSDNVIAPQNPTGLHINTRGVNNMLLSSYIFGNNGTPDETPSSIRIYWHTNSFTKTNLVGISSKDVMGTTSITVDGLAEYILYYFMIIKTYSNYGLFESNIVNELTAKRPSAPSIGVTNVHATNCIVFWNGFGDDGDPNESPTTKSLFWSTVNFNDTILNYINNGTTTPNSITYNSKTIYYVNIDTILDKQIDNLQPDNTYYVQLVKNYTIYDIVQSTMLQFNTQPEGYISLSDSINSPTSAGTYYMNDGYRIQCTSDTYCPIVPEDLLYPYVVVSSSTSGYVVHLYINVSSQCSIHTALYSTYSDLLWLNLLNSHQIRLLSSLSNSDTDLQVGVNYVSIDTIPVMGIKNVSLSFILKHQDLESKVYKIHLHELVYYQHIRVRWYGTNTEPILTYDGIYRDGIILRSDTYDHPLLYRIPYGTVYHTLPT